VCSSDLDGRLLTPILDTSEILLPGDHNVENYLAAIAAVRGLVRAETIKKVARSFEGVAHRRELVRTLRGVRYYNDSIASSPTRTIAGLRSFDRKVILIAGGKDKGIEYDALGPEIVEHVKTLILTGMTAGKIRQAVENAPNFTGSPEMIELDSFREAVIAAHQHAEEGDIVVLSPASTSFDRFKNFEERGNTFKDIVNSLE
jgi:UDP-N-acetylmuramoylalanine--D-glutamate ligase